MCLVLSIRLPALADNVPTLNDILNATQLDVRSSSQLPRPNDARVMEVRADAPLRQEFLTGTNVVRIAKIAIWFSGWSETWTPEKSLVLTLTDGERRTTVLAKAEEPYSQRLWEGAVHVFTLNATVESNHLYAFELSVDGGGNLRGAALATEPYLPGAGRLLRAGRPLAGPLWFETMVKRRANLDVLYSNVFAHFDLTKPDMAEVRQAVAARDWENAKRALVAHFEGRKDLFPAPVPNHTTAAKQNVGKTKRASPGIGKGSKSETVAAADLAVEHKVQAVDEIVDLGPRWNHLAAWRTRGGVGLTRTGLRGFLANAYTQTRDEKYARAWDAMLRFQFEDLPSPLRAGVIAPDAEDIPPIGDPGIGGGSMWASLSIGARMGHGFAYYRAFQPSPNFSLDTRFAFIVNLAEMSDVLEKMKGGGNWEAQNTSAMFDFALNFPEFRKAPVWLERGFDGAMQSCLENTFADGALKEATTNYHNLSLNRYLDVLETVRNRGLAGLEIPAEVSERIERMGDYTLFSTMPNGQLPRWGDSNPPADGASLLKRSADYFHRPDMLWVASAGKEGTPPKQTSIAFPDAGYYLMRSGWDSHAAFLALHNGHSSAHGHADANSLVLTAAGHELLIDPGVYIYGTPEALHLARTVSHNTVTMDDKDTVNDKGEAFWSTGRLLDVYDGVNAGYADQKRGDTAARHRRQVIFFKPNLFFVVDVAAGQRPHDWALHYHFAPGKLEPSTDGRSLLFHPAPSEAYRGATGAGLRVWSATPGDSANLVLADGLASAGWEQKLLAPVASWATLQSSTAYWATLLEPFGANTTTQSWDVQQDENGTAFAYQRTPDSRRFLLVKMQRNAPVPEEWTDKTALSTDADIACFEERRAGRVAPTVRKLAIISGSSFRERGTDAPAIFTSTLSVTRLDAVWNGEFMTVHREGGMGIQLETFGARLLTLDGKKISLNPAIHVYLLPDEKTP